MRTTIDIDDEINIKLKKYCKSHGYSLTGLVNVLLRERLNE